LDAALGLILRGIAEAGELIRHEMIRIPEVEHARIGQAVENHRPRRREIREQNRFPDCEHPHVRAPTGFQDFFDCGDPPQACRSGGRQEQDDPDGSGGSVELGLEGRAFKLDETRNLKFE